MPWLIVLISIIIFIIHYCIHFFVTYNSQRQLYRQHKVFDAINKKPCCFVEILLIWIYYENYSKKGLLFCTTTFPAHSISSYLLVRSTSALTKLSTCYARSTWFKSKKKLQNKKTGTWLMDVSCRCSFYLIRLV